MQQYFHPLVLYLHTVLCVHLVFSCCVVVYPDPLVFYHCTFYVTTPLQLANHVEVIASPGTQVGHLPRFGGQA